MEKTVRERYDTIIKNYYKELVADLNKLLNTNQSQLTIEDWEEIQELKREIAKMFDLGKMANLTIENQKYTPTKAYKNDSGFDLKACLADDYEIWEIELKPGERRAIPTGIAIEWMEKGMEAVIRPKSGLALKHGLTVLNSPGTIDNEYRGVIDVILINLGQETVTIKDGQNIAQLVFQNVEQTNFEIRELGSSEISFYASSQFEIKEPRSNKGFGSSDKKINIIKVAQTKSKES